MQSFLGVSYPTARQRMAELLGQLGFADQAADRFADQATDRFADQATDRFADPATDRSDPSASTDSTSDATPVSAKWQVPTPARPKATDSGEVLAQVAAGLITVAQAEELLGEVYRI